MGRGRGDLRLGSSARSDLFHARDAAECKEHDVFGADSERTCDRNMSELVRDDACKHGKHREGRRAYPPLRCRVREGAACGRERPHQKCEDEQPTGIDPDGCAEDACDLHDLRQSLRRCAGA